jgi:hypothetical protein
LKNKQILAEMTLIMVLLSTAAVAFNVRTALSQATSVTGAIWTSDKDGYAVNGNLYTARTQVYLVGGPHKEGAAGLEDGIYCFQVTDPAGKTLLSTDDISNRMFEVKDGYIFSIEPGTHKWNYDTTRGYGIVIQLYPFKASPNKGGTYKVWVTKFDYYSSPTEGSFGFISSLSKTDNFKVGLHEAAKYFELWVTPTISASPYVEFYVNYTVDVNGTPATPMTQGCLRFDRAADGYEIFRYETTFELGSLIYWSFSVSNGFDWSSGLFGPESILQDGMVNQEFIFLVQGHKFNYFNGEGLGNWTIELYRDNVKIDEALTDPCGYYAFIATGAGDYEVREVVKSNEGWVSFGPSFFEFTVNSSNGGEYTYDFYNYKMLAISDTSSDRTELYSFHPVFTPDGSNPDMYKLSSTNPGSFYANAIKYGGPGTQGNITIDLPPQNTFDSPNFILHHTYIGSTPILDIHVYDGRGSGELVPGGNDITNLYTINATEDGKHVFISGEIPSTGLLFVTVHIDYQIASPLTWEQVQQIFGSSYVFTTTAHFSIQGVTRSVNAN